jgi:hypothetical protein
LNPTDFYRTAKAQGLSDIACIRLIRHVFHLSLTQAKEVMVVANEYADSLVEHQENIWPVLEKALQELEADK